MAKTKRIAVGLDTVDEARLGVIGRRRGLDDLPPATLLRVLVKEKLAEEVVRLEVVAEGEAVLHGERHTSTQGVLTQGVSL